MSLTQFCARLSTLQWLPLALHATVCLGQPALPGTAGSAAQDAYHDEDDDEDDGGSTAKAHERLMGRGVGSGGKPLEGSIDACKD
jgi:hypothetical protein